MLAGKSSPMWMLQVSLEATHCPLEFPIELHQQHCMEPEKGGAKPKVPDAKDPGQAAAVQGWMADENPMERNGRPGVQVSLRFQGQVSV